MNQRPGIVASQVARVLQGKHKPIYHPGADVGDHVVVINAAACSFSGKKWEGKTYFRHTGYPGGVRIEQAKHLHARKPTEVIKKATWGMLPRNKLRRRMMERLYLFEENEHPYEANILAELECGRPKREETLPAPFILRSPRELQEFEQELAQRGVEVELLHDLDFEEKSV